MLDYKEQYLEGLLHVKKKKLIATLQDYSSPKM